MIFIGAALATRERIANAHPEKAVGVAPLLLSAVQTVPFAEVSKVNLGRAGGRLHLCL